MAKHTLDQWIREAILDTGNKGPCTALSLVHIQAPAGEKEVHTLELGAGQQYDPLDLAKSFRGRAENHASEMMGMQTFNLLAFYNNRTEAQARRPFTVAGQMEYSGMTEPPSKEGQTMQGMRHQEAVIQMGLRHTQFLFETQAQTVTALINHNKALMGENREAFEVMKELMIQQINSNHTREMERLAYERSSAERAKWLGMAPGLVNSLLGKEIFPQSNVDSTLIESIMKSLDDESIQMLQAKIPAPLWGALMERMTQAMRKQAVNG